MMKAAVSMIALAACAGSVLAQTDRLYMPDTFNSNQLYIVQGGSLIGTGPSVGSNQAGIAVAGDVRIMGYSGGLSGGQYNLAGSPLGPTYTNTGATLSYDGTTDGKYNYACNWSGQQVYQFDRDWQNPTLLFNTGFDGMFGITYDSKTNTLWTTNRFTSTTQNWSMSGSLLSSFSSPIDGIAFEASTGTLWYNQYGSNQITQYNTSGGYMQTVTISGLGASYGYSIEFDVPAPGSLALLGLGGLAAARRRRA